LLGDFEGCLAVGEALGHFFGVPRTAEAPCGCGVSATTCSFWRDVRFPAEFQQMTAGWFRLRDLAFIETRRREHKQDTDRLLEAMYGLYKRVAEKTSSRVIIDSSKNPVLARLLSWIPEIELSVIHLLRDPRSVVASYRYPKAYLPALSPAVVTARWIALSLASENLRKYVSSYTQLRYEDFAAQPYGVIRRIVPRLGCIDTIPSAAGQTVTLRSNHMLGGNPDKFECGAVKIAVRASELNLATNIFVSVVAAPLLRRYNYWKGGKFS
jgi:hypothetical protein